MLTGRTLHLVAPATWEANEMPPASGVYAEILRKGIRDVSVIAGPVGLSLTTADPVLYPGLLAGTKTQQVASGAALFNGLSINVPGPYQLHASCENDQLQTTPSSPTTGTLTLWRVYNLPIPADVTHMGRWVNFTGSGVPLGIWGKVVDVGLDPSLGHYWSVEQPTGTTSLSTLLSYSGLITVKYNSAGPLTQPPNYLVVGIDSWFVWNPLGPTYLASTSVEESNETLTAMLEIEVLRTVSIEFTSVPTEVDAGTPHGVLAAILNKDGTLATDITGVDIDLEIRSGAALVYSDQVPVVNGNIFTTVTMPLVAGPYSISISYQGTWYQAALVSDTHELTVVEAPPAEEPGTPPPAPFKFPPKVFELQVGGCYLEFTKNTVLELDAPDTFIEVLVK